MSETKTLHAAMAAAFPNIAGALKDSNNPHFRSKYADLSSVDAAIRPALASQELFYYQMTHEQSGGVCVETFVSHSGGETLSFGKLFVPASKQDAQGYGSALTYARRYSLMTAFGVCPEDDDGNAAAAAPRDEPAARKQAPKETGERITNDQFFDIAHLVAQTNTDPLAFCKAYGINNINELPASKLADATKALNNKLKKQGAAE